jgi:uncharacterized protein (DUF433 family)
MNWLDCENIESIPGKVSGAPLIVGTRIPVSAIMENYEAFLSEAMSHEAALRETAGCYPSASVQVIDSILSYDHSLQPQSQP